MSNSNTGDKQIEQMMAFIKQEAIEKAEEIKWKTEAEVNATKLNLIRQKRQELNELYKKKEIDIKVQKDIEKLGIDRFAFYTLPIPRALTYLGG